MGGFKTLILVFVVALSVASAVGGEVHHVLGTHPSLVATWSSARIFTVGDHIWFRYWRADDERNRMVEVKSMEEYLSCDVSNPINMYTDKAYLEEVGIRYFASPNVDSCKRGFKLHVDVQSRPIAAAAAAPTSSAPPAFPNYYFLSFSIILSNYLEHLL